MKMKKTTNKKDRAYNRYAKRLRKQNLFPEEYERLLKEWCEKHNY